MKTLIMRMDKRGTITEMSEEARDQFGDCKGLECARVVRAQALTHKAVCRVGCQSEGRGPGTVANPHGTPVRVMGRIGRLTCTDLGPGRALSLELTDRRLEVVEPLTPREREVLSHVAEGRTTGVIARRLGISEATVRSHVEHARDKLGARTRAEAVHRALLTNQLG